MPSLTTDTSQPGRAAGDRESGFKTRVERERDFYRQLLELGTKDEIEPFLEEALSLIVDLAGGRRGYLELQGDADGGDEERFWLAHGCYDEEVEEIRAAFSRGVIAEALATGRTIITESALRDPRFQSRGSVRRNQTEAVLCAPIGGVPPLGVLYLQDRLEGGAFSEHDRSQVEAFARHIAPFADRLLVRRRRRKETDPTLPFRKTLCVGGLVGRSAALAGVLQQTAAAATLDVTVLLTGPSGTGKTQIARILHNSGRRARGPFVELNCATLQDSLFENELFGALPGAHSTAGNRRVEGKVAAAQGGTLFLDEIGELTPAAQAKLLQLLQSKEYYPLGGTRPVRADVRVIAATNRDLRAAVGRREFREDLFYRLQVLPIRMPSLAERREDLAPLAEHFCEEACERHGLPRIRLSSAALRAAEVQEWSGNVRELAHAVEAAAIRAAGEGVSQIELRHLFPETVEPEPRSYKGLTLQQATHRFQSQLLLETLEDTGWNVKRAAARLDVARSYAYKLIDTFGLERHREPASGAVPRKKEA